VAVAPGGGDVYALSIDPEAALIDYLEMFYKLQRAGKALTRFGVVDFVTTVAPGLRDVLLTGKATEAVRRRSEGRFVYDAVVMDAPPTGRITRFLNVNAEVAGLAKVGPIHNHADKVMDVIRSPETAVHFVTLLEEMPVQETLDGIAELREADLPPGGIMINMTRPATLAKRDLDAAMEGTLPIDEIVTGLKASGLPGDERTARALASELGEHAVRLGIERREKRRLAAAKQPRYTLPLVTDGMDLSGLYRLAGEMSRQGAA